ncbi:MAG: site-specific integrase [Nocardioidaceae bacterium]
MGAGILTTIVHLRTVTRGDYERQLRVHILPTFADQAVARITQVDVRRFIAELRARGMAPKTLQKVRLVLRQVLEPAHRGWLGHKSITVTIDVYGHLFPSLSEALAERLDEVFRRAAHQPATPPAMIVDFDAGRRAPS